MNFDFTRISTLTPTENTPPLEAQTLSQPPSPKESF